MRRTCSVVCVDSAINPRFFQGVEQRPRLASEMLMSLRTLLVGREGLDHAKSLIAGYKQGKIRDMNAELWSAKKIVDSTLHPGMLLGL